DADDEDGSVELVSTAAEVLAPVPLRASAEAAEPQRAGVVLAAPRRHIELADPIALGRRTTRFDRHEAFRSSRSRGGGHHLQLQPLLFRCTTSTGAINEKYR